MRIVLFLTVFFVSAAAQGGGMAELKSITGDGPYLGTGNAPAPLPQPMGFWGRPRYSPVGFRGSPYWGYDPYGPDRFTVGHSPYGVAGAAPYRPNDSMFAAMMSFLDGVSSPFGSSSPRRAPSPIPASLPSASGDKFSPGGLGGFYKGSGN